MGKLKFDGERLKDGSKTIANVRDDRIRKGTGTSVLCNIRGDTVREGTGTKVIFNMRGDDLRLGTSTSRIATMKDVDGAIEGPGGHHEGGALVLVCSLRKGRTSLGPASRLVWRRTRMA
ncbi:MAG: hypothetical protein RLZZ461_67 [Planctomycetota bacterium]|jgi:hypothetical protein